MCLCIAVGSWASDGSEPDPAPSPSPVRVLGVEEFMKHVDQHRGEVQVAGIVSTVAPTRKTLALIDSKEFKECGVVTCAAFTLPVKWDGEMPSVKDSVQIRGKAEEVDGKLIFVANKVVKRIAGEKK